MKDDVDSLWAKPSPTTCGQPGCCGVNSKDPVMEMPTISSALPTRWPHAEPGSRACLDKLASALVVEIRR